MAKNKSAAKTAMDDLKASGRAETKVEVETVVADHTEAPAAPRPANYKAIREEREDGTVVVTYGEPEGVEAASSDDSSENDA